MKRLLLVLMLVGCALLCFANGVTAQTPPEPEPLHFQPPQTISVTEIAIPKGCLVNGTVVLDALITEEGKPQEIEIRRDIPCIAAPAVEAVENWKFSPAMVKGRAVASRIMVAVTFCPVGAMADPISAGTLKPQTDAAVQAEFQPAEVLHGKYPLYPVDATAFGTVVLEATLTARAEVENVKVVRDLPPFTTHTRDAVGEWRFMAATDNGSPIASKVVLAFVFLPMPQPYIPSNN